MKFGRKKAATRIQKPALMPLIQGMLPSLRRAQLRIAQALVSDPEQFISHSISQQAAACRVSAGSIVIFCRSVGLSGFPALKLALARELSEPVLPSGKNRRQTAHSASAVPGVFDQHFESLRQTQQLNAPEKFDAAVKSLLQANRIVFFSIGLSFPTAQSLYARLRFIGLPASIEFDSHLQIVAASELQRRDVAFGISVSGSTRETVECLQLAKKRGAKTICITNSIGSPLAEAADIAFYAAPSAVKYFQAPLASRVSQLALADVLLGWIGQRRRRQALAHVRRAEESLLQHRIPGSSWKKTE